MQKHQISHTKFVRNPNIQSKVTPAPNARRVITMMAEFKDREYKSLLPPIGKYPLDPNLPKYISDWQDNVKEWKEGTF